MSAPVRFLAVAVAGWTLFRGVYRQDGVGQREHVG